MTVLLQVLSCKLQMVISIYLSAVVVKTEVKSIQIPLVDLWVVADQVE